MFKSVSYISCNKLGKTISNITIRNVYYEYPAIFQSANEVVLRHSNVLIDRSGAHKSLLSRTDVSLSLLECNKRRSNVPENDVFEDSSCSCLHSSNYYCCYCSAQQYGEQYGEQYGKNLMNNKVYGHFI